MNNEDSKNCSSHCPNCRKTQTGAIEVAETKNENISIIHVKETSDRN